MQIRNWLTRDKIGAERFISYIGFIVLAYVIGGTCILSLITVYISMYRMGMLAMDTSTIYFHIYFYLIPMYSLSIWIFAFYILIAFISDMIIEDDRRKDLSYESWISHTKTIVQSKYIQRLIQDDYQVNKVILCNPNIDLINGNILEVE
jgi:hypothetical protein